mmetsp:Transcript_78325/g.254439  ORF Transcript_78325/g.254439 Transcript_78325/m.254439 type:complete len:218 (+) Transcript_78325:3-656(+)
MDVPAKHGLDDRQPLRAKSCRCRGRGRGGEARRHAEELMEVLDGSSNDSPAWLSRLLRPPSLLRAGVASMPLSEGEPPWPQLVGFRLISCIRPCCSSSCRSSSWFSLLPRGENRVFGKCCFKTCTSLHASAQRRSRSWSCCRKSLNLSSCSFVRRAASASSARSRLSNSATPSARAFISSFSASCCVLHCSCRSEHSFHLFASSACRSAISWLSFRS